MSEELFSQVPLVFAAANDEEILGSCPNLVPAELMLSFSQDVLESTVEKQIERDVISASTCSVDNLNDGGDLRLTYNSNVTGMRNQ